MFKTGVREVMLSLLSDIPQIGGHLSLPIQIYVRCDENIQEWLGEIRFLDKIARGPCNLPVLWGGGKYISYPQNKQEGFTPTTWRTRSGVHQYWSLCLALDWRSVNVRNQAGVIWAYEFWLWASTCMCSSMPHWPREIPRWWDMNWFQKDPVENFELFWDIEAKGESKSSGKNDISTLWSCYQKITQIHLLHFEFDFLGIEFFNLN